MKQLVFMLLILVAVTNAAKDRSQLKTETILDLFNKLLDPQIRKASSPEITKLENTFKKKKLKPLKKLGTIFGPSIKSKKQKQNKKK